MHNSSEEYGVHIPHEFRKRETPTLHKAWNKAKISCNAKTKNICYLPQGINAELFSFSFAVAVGVSDFPHLRIEWWSFVNIRLWIASQFYSVHLSSSLCQNNTKYSPLLHSLALQPKLKLKLKSKCPTKK